MKLRILILLLIICPNAETNQHNYLTEDNYKFSQNTWGGIGLIQNPTARFSNDGEFTFGISSESPYSRMYSTIQFFPWMEASLRYTEATYTPYNFGNSQTWKDKGFDLKLKLLDEKDHLPALAIGALDLGGTGFYSSEYIVMSKMLRNLDFQKALREK